MKRTLAGLGLHTVCEEALCPNIGECFSRAQATFLILGKACTRACAFCGVGHGTPSPVDAGEPARVARGVERLGLTHVVVTSVTRDDLPDGGAKAFVDTVSALRALGRKLTIELLIPDFGGDRLAIRVVAASRPDILAHNIETVPRLYCAARSGADYHRSLEVLSYAKEYSGALHTKSGIILGLGEREDEVLGVFDDIAKVGCDFLSIGQYLAPNRSCLPVKEYIRPEQFAYYRKKALEAGLKHVMSGPYVRSSYSAAEYLETETEAAR